VSYVINGQHNLEFELDSITTLERAEKFIEENKSSQSKILTFNEEKHKTQLSEQILKLNLGGTEVIENEIEKIRYKVIEKNEIIYYRVSYIFLDGTKISYKTINALRPKIIAQLKNGVPFETLANSYSMDNTKNKAGDTGWITFGDMLPEFEDKVMNDDHQIEDIYTVNVESNKWYYIVKKTHDKKVINEVKVLKVTETKY
jgi:parvulin-like peptidyl-prolyl isomerase